MQCHDHEECGAEVDKSEPHFLVTYWDAEEQTYLTHSLWCVTCFGHLFVQ